MTLPTVSIVLPVRDAGPLVDGCLSSVMPEARTWPADVVVVDDASTDDTATRAGWHAGVRVLRHDRPGGPDQARETGWRASTGEVVVFVDVRCRVGPGWLAALVRAVCAPGVAIAGAGYRIEPGHSVAGRAAAAQDGFRPAATLEDAHLPYLPGGNLAVRRTALEAVGGFAAAPTGGGDMTLCWAVQLAGEGRVVHAPGAQVTWLPRTRVADYVRQRAKYGDYRVPNALRFADHGLVPGLPASFPVLVHLSELVRRVVATRGHDLAVQATVTAADVAHARAYRRAYLRAASAGQVPAPPSRWTAVARRVRSRLPR